MSDMILTLQQIQQWLPASELVGDPGVVIHRVHTDTRTLQAGDLFVAIQGERFDAHEFLAQAKTSGAVAALAQHGLQAAGLSGVQVPDTRLALGQLAHAWRAQFELPVVAVTGSNGKTTVTQMVASILRAAYAHDSWATQGNFNNDIGVPLTLFGLRAHHRAAVVELGMNHPGEIAALADMTQPSVALINNAQREHQEFMASVEAVAQENGQVLHALSATGVAVFPADDEFASVWKQMAGQRRCLRFSMTSDQAEVRLMHAQWTTDHWQIQAHTPQGILQAQLHIAGRHNIANALAATAAGLAAGVDLAHIAAGLNDFVPVKGRSRAFSMTYQQRVITVVDDTYNANPDSVLAAIEVLAELPGPKILVLGDMGEVGDQGVEFHREVGEYALARGLDALLCLGELTRHSALAAQSIGHHFEDIESLKKDLHQRLEQVGSILIKGSRFMKMERLVEGLSAMTDPQQGHTQCC